MYRIATQRPNRGYRGGYGTTGGRGPSAANIPSGERNLDMMRYDDVSGMRQSAPHITSSAEYLNDDLRDVYNVETLSRVAMAPDVIIGYILPIALTNATMITNKT